MLLRRAFGLVSLLVAVSTLAFSGLALAQQGPADANPWRTMLEQDFAFTRKTLEEKYIYAVYPGESGWTERYGPAAKQGLDAIASVKDFNGYRAVLSRFISTFQDPHLTIRFDLQAANVQWPRFIASYSAGRYIVDKSQVSTVKAGDQITSCDGKPLNALADELALLEGFPPGVEVTRARLAPRVFADIGNPFFKRPETCRIGAADITLDWTRIPAEGLAVVRGVAPAIADVPVGLSPFGKNGAWIRLPLMSPRNQQDADAYHDVMKQADVLRGKDIIVFDVRGNGGGPYDWFVAILKSIYGETYASYYARERLRIEPVFVASEFDGLPAGPTATQKPATPPPADPYKTPRDVELYALLDDIKEVTLPSGRKIAVMSTKDPKRIERPAGAPPANPVKAQVFVLTDYGCGSACTSFVDEMLQFPGVKQIGLETGVDMRSGTPISHRLPSGLGGINVASMVRDKRVRGENVQHVPSIRYDGDINDTAAVQKWVLETVAR